MKTCMQAWPARARDRDQVHVEARAPDDLLASVTRRTAMIRSRKRAAASKLIVLGRIGHLVLQPREQRFLVAFEEEHDLVDRVPS